MRGEGLISSDSGDIFSNDPRVWQSPLYDTPAPKACAASSSLWEEVGIWVSGQGCPALGGEALTQQSPEQRLALCTVPLPARVPAAFLH